MTNHNNGYIEQGHRYLEQAFAELEQDDLRQASEKGWGAASQLVKAYAAEQGLPHDGHGLLFRAVRHLVEETGDISLHTLFNAAGGLHQNFYEGEHSDTQVRHDLEQVTEFVSKVEAVLNGG